MALHGISCISLLILHQVCIVADLQNKESDEFSPGFQEYFLLSRVI